MQQKHCIFHCQPPHKWTNMFDQIWSMPNANLPPFSMPSLSRVHIPQADRRLLPSHRSIITSTAITALRETLLKHFVAYYRNPSWPGPSGSSFAVQLEMPGISECPKIAVSSSCCEQSRAAWYIWRLLIFFRVRCWPIWANCKILSTWNWLSARLLIPWVLAIQHCKLSHGIEEQLSWCFALIFSRPVLNILENF